ncbi:MAG: hypothetical protein LBK97_06450 [Prevotellaceae bacterium]|nr:hypothetical protein [Prevotellaceae bacterium]
MKKVFLTWMAFFTAIVAADAQQIFNVQNGNRTVFFDDLETAVTEAVSGDTIYLPGGQIELKNTLIINKKLALIGVGADSIGQGTQMTRITQPVHFISGSDGSLMTGCRINNSLTIGKDGSDTIQNIMIFRNVITGNISFGLSENYYQQDVMKKIFIIENVINGHISKGIWVASPKECVIQNNLFPFGTGAASISGFSSSLIQNNIVTYISDVESCIISNNIINRYFGNIGSNCVYENNACFFENWLTGTNNTFHNNLMNQSAEATFKNSAGSSPKDRELLSGSPCRNAGTDGTDIGIYGGSSPFKNGSVPINPHISKVNISNVTDSEGKIKVDIKVSAQER